MISSHARAEIPRYLCSDIRVVRVSSDELIGFGHPLGLSSAMESHSANPSSPHPSFFSPAAQGKAHEAAQQSHLESNAAFCNVTFHAARFTHSSSPQGCTCCRNRKQELLKPVQAAQPPRVMAAQGARPELAQSQV